MDIDTTLEQVAAAQSAGHATGLETGRVTRRQFSPAFKARIVKLTDQPGAVVAEVARSHGLGPGLVTRWRREHRKSAPAKAFVPIQVAAGAEAISEIRIECIRGQQRVSIAWPASAAKECAQWLREWLA